MNTTKQRPHGYARYTLDGCGCETCHQDKIRYERDLRRRHAYGHPPYVDAEPARQHIRSLQAAGMGWQRIARNAGVYGSVLSKLIYGDPKRGMAPSKRIRPETANKLLSVTLDTADCAVIGATGTRRRLQALVTIGWSQAKIAHKLGMYPSNFGRTLHCDQVYAATARAVAALYEQLWETPPPQDSHRDRIAANRARNHAKTHGWQPPMAWDDDTIDIPEGHEPEDEDTVDPDDVDEVAVELAIAGKRRSRQLTHNDRDAAIRELYRRGYTPTSIANRIGVSHATVVKAQRNGEVAA